MSSSSSSIASSTGRSVSSGSATHASASSTSSSAFPPLPTGCAHLHGTTSSESFNGCVVGNATVLQLCCSSVGSTPGFINGTCGCPYNPPAFAGTQADIQNFFACVSNHSYEGGCSDWPTSGAGRAVGWNAAVIVLGVSLFLGVVGA
ncbi:hypothetical protein R3P38DRAFT_415334 [Favolaschia claudopus]|uniref:Uncharacterized protein n=1 Tax=Favolaschia claudopus TaxID=2862362 RepID=A0AAV9ZGW7_9AGAR